MSYTFKSYVEQKTVPCEDCLALGPHPRGIGERTSAYYHDNPNPPWGQNRACLEHWLQVIETNSSGKRTFIIKIQGDSQTLKGKNMTRTPETGTSNKEAVCPYLCGFAVCLSTETVLATCRDEFTRSSSWGNLTGSLRVSVRQLARKSG